MKHEIKAGESLKKIAEKYKTSVNALRQGNRLSSSHIEAGRYLLIPTPLKNTSNKKLYIVQRGDTLWNIAKQFSVNSKDIVNGNNTPITKALLPGQTLIIKKS